MHGKIVHFRGSHPPNMHDPLVQKSRPRKSSPGRKKQIKSNITRPLGAPGAESDANNAWIGPRGPGLGGLVGAQGAESVANTVRIAPGRLGSGGVVWAGGRQVPVQRLLLSPLFVRRRSHTPARPKPGSSCRCPHIIVVHVLHHARPLVY